MRVCLISPGHLSTNPRLVKEARTLSEAGHDVSIVCGRYLRWGEAQDRALVDKRWRVTHVPFGPVEAPRSTYVFQSLRCRVATALVRAGVGAREITEMAHGPMVWDLQRAACKVSADLYIAHYVAALPAAVRASAMHGTAYAFDAEDFHQGDMPEAPEHALHRQLIRDIESRCIPGASYVTAASPMIADAYVKSYDIARPMVVLNVFPRSNAPPAPSARGTTRPGPSIYWFSQTIGPGRGIETAVEAIARAATAPHLYLRGMPATGYEDVLGALARRHDVGDRLHFLALEAPGEMERLGAQYDLGFSGESGFSRNNACALGNKLFSYLLGGVPIIASDVPAHRGIAPELGEAMSLFRNGNAAALAAVIDQRLSDPARLAAARTHAWSLAQQRYCWDVEQRVFLDAVEGALAHRRLSVA